MCTHSHAVQSKHTAVYTGERSVAGAPGTDEELVIRLRTRTAGRMVFVLIKLPGHEAHVSTSIACAHTTYRILRLIRILTLTGGELLNKLWAGQSGMGPVQSFESSVMDSVGLLSTTSTAPVSQILYSALRIHVSRIRIVSRDTTIRSAPRARARARACPSRWRGRARADARMRGLTCTPRCLVRNPPTTNRDVLALDCWLTASISRAKSGRTSVDLMMRRQ